jgi:hypothetical protein
MSTGGVKMLVVSGAISGSPFPDLANRSVFLRTPRRRRRSHDHKRYVHPIPGEVSHPGQLGPRGGRGLARTGDSGETKHEAYWLRPPTPNSCPNCKSVWQCLDNAVRRWEASSPSWCLLGTNCQSSVDSLLSECGLSKYPPEQTEWRPSPSSTIW